MCLMRLSCQNLQGSKEYLLNISYHYECPQVIVCCESSTHKALGVLDPSLQAKSAQGPHPLESPIWRRRTNNCVDNYKAKPILIRCHNGVGETISYKVDKHLPISWKNRSICAKRQMNDVDKKSPRSLKVGERLTRAERGGEEGTLLKKGEGFWEEVGSELGLQARWE